MCSIRDENAYSTTKFVPSTRPMPTALRSFGAMPEQLEQQVGELLGLGSLDDPLGAAVNGYDVGAAIVDQRSRAGQAPSRNGGYLSVASRNA
jgi:hypothetical protein